MKTLSDIAGAHKSRWLKPVRKTHGRSDLAGHVQHDHEFSKTFAKLLDGPTVNYSDWNLWNPKPPDVRPSSFPFCARRHIGQQLGPGEDSDFTVRSCFFTGQGTAIHAVSQNAIARTGQLFGFWTCARPSCEKLFSKEPGFLPALRKKRCKHCDSEFFNYHEIEMADESLGLVMHTDGILIAEDHQATLEIKSAADDKVTFLKHQSQSTLEDLFATTSPWFGYWHQASTYGSHAEKAYPKLLTNLTHILFHIQSRDKPHNFVNIRVNLLRKVWRNIRADVRMAQYAKEKRILPMPIVKSETEIKTNPACKYCMYKEDCFSPKLGDDYVDCRTDALFDKKARKQLQQYRDHAFDTERPSAVGRTGYVKSGD